MNKRGDTPVWTIIVFGIIALLVIILAVLLISNTSTAGGEKFSNLYGLIQTPETVQVKSGSSIIDDSCSVSTNCASGLACINGKCAQASSQDMVIGGQSKCANNYASYAPHGAAAGRDWCMALTQGITYQIEYNNGLIFDDKNKKQTTADSIVMLDITAAGNRRPTFPELPKGSGPSQGNPESLTWLPTNTIYTIEGEPGLFVCGWYLDKKCSDNDGEVLVRVYQLRETPEADSGETEGTQPGQ